ncbi:MAG TPA: hypothetical protein VF503_22290 [Sphingobium sp.]|uniref:hypothetical protein n=1 Tax=Sphingobium sp. TaxID=1912891 RepID=UPI002ED4A261
MAKAERTMKREAAISGMRGLGTGIVVTLIANQVRASAGQAGLAGIAAGITFNIMLKRTPVGAILFGGALLAHRAYKSSKAAQAKRDGRKARAKGARTAPDEPKPVKLAPAAA